MALAMTDLERLDAEKVPEECTGMIPCGVCKACTQLFKGIDLDAEIAQAEQDARCWGSLMHFADLWCERQIERELEQAENAP